MEPLEYLQKIESFGFSCYITGGYVRDKLMGIDSNDVDITTSALPKDIAEIFGVPNDETLGCLRLPNDKYKIEVTTYRKESGYTKRHPKIEYIEDIDEDLTRRDFTINAICMDSKGNIYDPLNGQKDIEEHTIRVIGDIDQKFKEDPLRMMRALRLSILYDFNIESKALEFILANKDLLKNISYARKKEELEKIFLSNRSKQGYERLKSFDLLETLDLSLVEDFYPAKSKLGIWSQFDVSCYPFTKQEKNSMMKIREILSSKKIDENTLFNYGLEENLIAGELSGLDDDEILLLYQNLPIHSKDDLAVDGNDIKRLLGLTDGKDIENIKEDLIDEILKRNLVNQKKKLEEYIIKKWK